jgi:hypothetical protein
MVGVMLCTENITFPIPLMKKILPETFIQEAESNSRKHEESAVQKQFFTDC